MAATSARSAKIALLAERLGGAETAEIPVLTAWLGGSTRQRRTGIGWASLRDLPAPAHDAMLTVTQVDEVAEAAAQAAGSGSAGTRRALISELFAAATQDEQRFLTGLIIGELRQGAQTGLLTEAVAKAHQVPTAAVRRALTFAGDIGAVAEALHEHGAGALDGFGLQVGRALSPMLAKSAPDVGQALAMLATGSGSPAGAPVAAVEWKLDGVRIQVHRSGDRVAVFTRTLDDVTARLPEVVAAARSLPAEQLVLDGETIALNSRGRPRPFQVTASRVASNAVRAAEIPLTTWLFDVLHVDGEDLLDASAQRRREVLETLAPADLLVPRVVVHDAGQAQAVADAALAAGHEGVVVKSLDAPYAMGRRGAGWVKVKPRVTVDLVVLAVERGHGRRRGTLSNLHLGARDPNGEFGPPGGFVMLGKTFKGLTDAMLAWQTERLTALAVRDDGHTLTVRPELVVEIAFDSVQASPRYPAGMALRFARVLAHRPDKPAAEADTVETVRSHFVPDE